MPIYEYLCSSCQARTEVRQKFSDPPLTQCDRCGGAVTKVISAPAIMFKGSGWYVTDYSDKLKPPSSSEPAKGESKDSAKEGAAPAAAPATPASDSSAASTASGPGSSSTPAQPASSSSTSSSSSSSSSKS